MSVRGRIGAGATIAVCAGLVVVAGCRKDEAGEESVGRDGGGPPPVRSALSAGTPAAPAPAAAPIRARPAVGVAFKVAVEASAARLFPLEGGVAIVDGTEYLVAEAGGPLAGGAIPEPVSTTNHLVVDGMTGAPGAVWISFHYDHGETREEEGTRRLVGGGYAAVGFDTSATFVWPAGPDVSLVWMGVALRGLGRGGEEMSPKLVLAREDPATAKCLETFAPSHFRARADGTAAAAGVCSFDVALDKNTQPVVLRLEVVGDPDADAGADAGGIASSYRVHVDPLPGAGRDDIVTGLAVGDETIASVVARTATNATEARVLSTKEGRWAGLPTPLPSPAIGLSLAPDGSLWMAGPRAVFRRDAQGAWWSVALPASKDVGVTGPLVVQAIAAASADDVWIAVDGGRRVLRTGPVDRVRTIALRDGAR